MHTAFWKTWYNLMLRYFVKSFFLCRDKNWLIGEMFDNSAITNFIVNRFTPSSSSSCPIYQGFVNVTFKNYANFAKTFCFFFHFLYKSWGKIRALFWFHVCFIQALFMFILFVYHIKWLYNRDQHFLKQFFILVRTLKSQICLCDRIRLLFTIKSNFWTDQNSYSANIQAGLPQISVLQQI